MQEQGKIGSMEAILLMMAVVLPTAILPVPAFSVRYAGQDAWLSVLIATLAGLLIARLVVSLSLRFPGKTLFEYTEEILGPAPGKIVGCLYLWWFMHTNALVIREYGAFLISAFMPDTPEIAFHVMAFAVMAYMIRNGLEVLSRFNQLVLPLVLGSLLIVFILTSKDMEIQRLLPAFDTGIASLLKGAATPASWLGEIITLTMLIPSLSKPREAHRIAAIAILLISFFLMASILNALLIFGPYVTASKVFPSFSAVRIVSIANFLERLESVLIAGWVLGGFAKAGAFYYVAALGSAQLLGVKDYRPLVLPVGVIMVALSYVIHEGVVDLLDFLTLVWPPYALSFEVGIPALLLIVALARGKGGKYGQ
jgi:spore germination protein KB